jgi:tripartite-type tricarboxylate transporter receptor subunit TctC
VLLGGHVDACSLSVGEAAPSVSEKQLSLIVVSNEERDPVYPDVPTFRELGLDITLAAHRGFIISRKVDIEIVNILRETFEKVATDPEYLAEMKAAALPAVYINGPEFEKIILNEKRINDVLVEKLGLKE